MANRLAVEFVASSATFEQDVKRATSTVEAAAGRMEKSAGLASAAIKGITSAFSVGAVIAWSKATIDGAERIKNFADEIGSTVENVSRLTNAVRIGGGDFNEMKSALETLSKGLAGVDDGGGKAAKALRFLGVESRDPATALEEIAKKLETFRDDAAKVAFVKDVFGNAGFVDGLKAIAANADVAASVTARQAEEATKLNEELRKLSIQSTAFSNVLLSSVVPALNDTIDELVEGTRIAGGFWAAVAAGATLSPFDNTAEAISKVRKELDGLKKYSVGGGVEEDLSNGPVAQGLRTKLALLEARQRRETARLTGDQFLDARDLRLRGGLTKPDLGYVPSPLRQGGRSGAEKVSEAQRYLESLQKQVYAAADLTATERALAEIQSGRLKGLTPEIERQILAVANEVDAYKELERWVRESGRAFEEQQRVIQDGVRERGRAAEAALSEAEQIRDANEQLRDEIAIIAGGEAARKALEKARISSAIAIKEEALAQLELDPLRRAEADAIESQIALLRERAELLGGRDGVQAMKDMADAAQALRDDFNAIGASSFSQFLQDLTTGDAKGALENLGNNLFNGINRRVADGLSESLFSSGGPLGDFGDVLGSLFGGGDTTLLAAGTTLTAAGTTLTGASALLTSAASALIVAASAQAAGDAADMAGQIAGAFLPYGGGFANGTNAVAMSGIYRVGERGPETVYLPRGAAVRPAHVSGGGSDTFNTVINVPPGAPTATMRQQSKQGLRAAVRARTRG